MKAKGFFFFLFPGKTLVSYMRVTEILWKSWENHPAPQKPLTASIYGLTHLQHLSHSPCSQPESHTGIAAHQGLGYIILSHQNPEFQGVYPS